MEAFQQRRLRDAKDDGFGARHPDHAGDVGGGGRDVLLERRHRELDALGVRQQGQPELGQSIPARLALHQRLPDAPFEFDEPPLHRRLLPCRATANRCLRSSPLNPFWLCVIAAPSCSFAPYAAKPRHLS
jgi:hypothetical protein